MQVPRPTIKIEESSKPWVGGGAGYLRCGVASRNWPALRETHVLLDAVVNGGCRRGEVSDDSAMSRNSARRRCLDYDSAAVRLVGTVKDVAVNLDVRP